MGHVLHCLLYVLHLLHPQGGRRIMWAAAADGARTPEAEVAARAWDRTRQLEQVETGDRTGPAAATGGRCPWWGPGQVRGFSMDGFLALWLANVPAQLRQL